MSNCCWSSRAASGIPGTRAANGRRPTMSGF